MWIVSVKTGPETRTCGQGIPGSTVRKVRQGGRTPMKKVLLSVSLLWASGAQIHLKSSRDRNCSRKGWENWSIDAPTPAPNWLRDGSAGLKFPV